MRIDGTDSFKKTIEEILRVLQYKAPEHFDSVNTHIQAFIQESSCRPAGSCAFHREVCVGQTELRRPSWRNAAWFVYCSRLFELSHADGSPKPPTKEDEAQALDSMVTAGRAVCPPWNFWFGAKSRIKHLWREISRATAKNDGYSP